MSRGDQRVKEFATDLFIVFGDKYIKIIPA